ncbi:MAG: hypothetical protein UR26_C0005G0017 [candidate division TM6 bacterium GW2011_GWF2_32_72]|nr:MAG: hypothetical protein UR26_C0005G0017 [candidate division TM6 bacterium GW2011_GWF2_32_72]
MKKFLCISAILAILTFSSLFASIRTPYVAGTWYAATQQALNKTLDNFFEQAKTKKVENKIKAIIVPHAGYTFSGQVAADAFNQIEKDYETVFILGPAHKYPLIGICPIDFEYWQTPLGQVKISQTVKDILKEPGIKFVPQADKGEHSLELEIPFLQKQIQDLNIVPILVGKCPPGDVKNILNKYLQKNDLIIVSADLSHYHPYAQAVELDNQTIQTILNLDSQKILSQEVDAPWAIAALLEIAKEKDWKPQLITYKNSGDVSGNKTNGVVGYCSIIFVEKKSQFSEAEKQQLHSWAKEAIKNHLQNKIIKIDSKNLDKKFLEKKGCFVTIKKNNKLRGCIGTILPNKPLYQCILDNAINAAVNDSRFSPIQQEELTQIELEISVLTPPTNLSFKSSQELLEKLQPNIDGVILSKNLNSATYLPQVWKDLPNKDEFLSSLCIKAGLSKDAWKQNNINIKTYQAEHF